MFDDAVFDDVSIRSFEYRIIEKGSLLRLDIRYDNDLEDQFAAERDYDESYLSGSTFAVFPANFK